MKIKVSFPRRRESRLVPVKTGNNRIERWIPAFAGMTKMALFIFYVMFHDDYVTLER